MMKIKSTRFEIRASIEFTKRDIEGLLLCSRNHYSPECKALSLPGGMLYGLNNKLNLCPDPSTSCGLRYDSTEWTLSTTEADVLAKCAEYGKYIDEVDPLLHVNMVRLLNQLNDIQREQNNQMVED
jgi:hypothetical protein